MYLIGYFHSTNLGTFITLDLQWEQNTSGLGYTKYLSQSGDLSINSYLECEFLRWLIQCVAAA